MSHKVHPKSFRIRNIADWNSRGFYGKKLAKPLEGDFRIRKFLKEKIGKLGVERVEIERSSGKISVIIFSARPGLLIGRGGQGLEELKKKLEKVMMKKSTLNSIERGKPSLDGGPEEKFEIRIEIKEVKNVWASSALCAQWVAGQIEKRVRWRRVLKQLLDKIMATKGVQGARVEVAGRLDGAEIARTEWLRRGRLPRQTLRADIDYAQEEARCTYGAVGIKVWIYKGERFD
ncbi:MAG: 30S ribosomal protein S3 [Candidatus Wildermuthbacteria bacterium]|nr:30S ribosomal protein S3 [Candidatus Wildermuthbacteria bacterium]